MITLHPENEKRADWAAPLVDQFTREVCGGYTLAQLPPDDQQCALGDLIGNILHLAQRLGFDPAAVLSSGAGHYEYESAPGYQGD